LSIQQTCLFLRFVYIEVFKRVLQEFGDERALDVMGIMSLGTIIDLDRQIGVHAAQISSELKLAMADSIMLATACACDAILWTQHEHFKGIEGVKFEKKRSRK
jgi:predicted nucleic acid-binding protein